MRVSKRVYVSGVGYTCSINKSLIELKLADNHEKNVKSLSDKKNTVKGSKGVTYLDRFIGSTKNELVELEKYSLALKIGYSDIKEIDLTSYYTKDIEVLVVGKECLLTPGYQELALEMESKLTASEIKCMIIVRGSNKDEVHSLAAKICNLRPYSVYKGIGLRLEGDPLVLKTFAKSKSK